MSQKKCIDNPPPLLPLGRYPQFFSKFQSILPSALIKSLCPDQKEGHVCVSDSKCQPRFTSCTAKESCEGILVSCSDQGVLREIFTCPFKRRRLHTYLTSRSATFPLLAQLKGQLRGKSSRLHSCLTQRAVSYVLVLAQLRKAVREIFIACPQKRRPHCIRI